MGAGRRSRYGPLYGLGERSYLSESLDPKHEERERQEKLNTYILGPRRVPVGPLAIFKEILVNSAAS